MRVHKSLRQSVTRRVLCPQLACLRSQWHAKPGQHAIFCTAKELPLRARVDEAKELLAQESIQADFALFEDADYEFLFRPEADGIGDSVAGARPGISRLRFDEWFTRFEGAVSEVPPCCNQQLG